MNMKKLPQWVIAALMVILLPGIGCFEYYTGQRWATRIRGGAGVRCWRIRWRWLRWSGWY
jgi:hypothetical protein